MWWFGRGVAVFLFCLCVVAVGLQYNAALICSEPEGGGAGSALALQLCRHYACVDVGGPGFTHAAALDALRSAAYVVTLVSPRLLADPWCLHLVDFVERTRGISYNTKFECYPLMGRHLSQGDVQARCNFPLDVSGAPERERECVCVRERKRARKGPSCRFEQRPLCGSLTHRMPAFFKNT